MMTTRHQNTTLFWFQSHDRFSTLKELKKQYRFITMMGSKHREIYFPHKIFVHGHIVIIVKTVEFPCTAKVGIFYKQTYGNAPGSIFFLSVYSYSCTGYEQERV